MIVSVNELHQKRRSSIADGVMSHTRAWQVVCDDPADGTAAALLAPGIPRYNDPGPNSTRAASIEASPVKESDVVFEVTAEFTGGEIAETPVHPLDRPPEFSWPGQEFTESWFYDFSKPNRKPYVNSVGDSFEQTSERIKGEVQIQMVRNEAFWDVLEAEAVANTTNADIVFLDGQGYAPDTLLMALPTAQKVSELWMGVQVDYYKVTRTFRARSDGWRHKVLDYGLYQLRERTKIIDGVSTIVKERVPILDAAGLKIQKPWPLDGQGRAKASATDTPAELDFYPYDSAPWASLSLA